MMRGGGGAVQLEAFSASDTDRFVGESVKESKLEYYTGTV